MTSNFLLILYFPVNNWNNLPFLHRKILGIHLFFISNKIFIKYKCNKFDKLYKTNSSFIYLLWNSYIMFQILSDRIMNTIGLQKYEIDGNIVHLYFEYVSFIHNFWLYQIRSQILHYRTLTFFRNRSYKLKIKLS